MKYSFAIAIALVCCGLYYAQADELTRICLQHADKTRDICKLDKNFARRCNYDCDQAERPTHHIIHFGRSIPDGAIPTVRPLGGEEITTKKNRVPSRRGRPLRFG